MSTGFETRSVPPEDLSALVDGELDGDSVANACRRWRTDADARASWHSYLLIGDVLRSGDLASTAAHDGAFLRALRVKLAAEPVVAAPLSEAKRPVAAARAPKSGRRDRWSWAAPSAVAAGFVAVAGVLVVTRNPPPVPEPIVQTTLAPVVVAEPLPLRPVRGTADAAEAPPVIASGQLIRDAWLDRYLAAHKHFSSSAALGAPSAFVRNATAEVGGR